MGKIKDFRRFCICKNQEFDCAIFSKVTTLKKEIYDIKFYVFLPFVSLLSFGVLFEFVEHIDTLLKIGTPYEIWAIFGSNYVVLSILGLSIAIFLAISYFIAYGKIEEAKLNFVYKFICLGMFFIIFWMSFLQLVRAWLLSFGVDVSSFFGIYLYIIMAMASSLLSATRPSFFSAFIVLRSQAVWIAAIGGLSMAPALYQSSGERRGDAKPDLQASSKPDVVLITIDALSAERMSLYAANRRTTRHIDAFAKGSILFENMYASSNFTTPGISSILTGLYPLTSNVVHLASKPPESAKAHSIPALLHKSGYRTGFVSTNPWAGPYRNGYAEYFDDGRPDAIAWSWGLCSDAVSYWLPYLCSSRNPLVTALFEATSYGRHRGTQFDPSIATGAAGELLAQFSEPVAVREPFFLWVHYWPPHDPYAAAEPWVGRFDTSKDARSATTSSPAYGYSKANNEARTRLLAARYDESVASVDAEVGKLLAKVERASPNALIIITADHGESFSHDWGGHGGPMLHKNVIKIPLVVRLPGLPRLGTRISTATSQTDIVEIVKAALAGNDSANIGTMIEQRRRLSPVLSMNFQEQAPGETLGKGVISAIEGHWQIIHPVGNWPRPVKEHQMVMAYDLLLPNGKPLPRSSVPKDVVARLDAHISHYLSSVTEGSD